MTIEKQDDRNPFYFIEYDFCDDCQANDPKKDEIDDLCESWTEEFGMLRPNFDYKKSEKLKKGHVKLCLSMDTAEYDFVTLCLDCLEKRIELLRNSTEPEELGNEKDH